MQKELMLLFVPQTNNTLSALFLIITLCSLLFFYLGSINKNTIVLAIFILWQVLIGVLANLQIFDNQPNLFPLVILGTVALTFLVLKRISKEQLNSNILLAIHVLRIPVELILFELFRQKQIPILMTFKGWNFDILIGISALIILIYQLVSKKRIQPKIFILWNYIGILFLLFIVALAILSSPLPIQIFAFDQPNIAVLQFPYCFLPTCVVPIVLISHILLIHEQIKTSI